MCLFVVVCCSLSSVCCLCWRVYVLVVVGLLCGCVWRAVYCVTLYGWLLFVCVVLVCVVYMRVLCARSCVRLCLLFDFFFVLVCVVV